MNLLSFSSRKACLPQLGSMLSGLKLVAHFSSQQPQESKDDFTTLGYNPKIMTRNELDEVKIYHKNLVDNFAAPPTNFFDLSIHDLDGTLVKFKKFKGFTVRDYGDLIAMYAQFSKKGLEIFGFPCNQFGKQESGCNKDIKTVVRKKLNCKFPVFEKIECNGPDTHPVYQYLRTQSILHDPVTKTTKGITWNFAKFLLNKDGKMVKFYMPEIAAIKIKPDIQELLKQ